KGTLNKMRAYLEGEVHYRLPVGEEEIDLAPFIGQTLTLTHTGSIYCCSCGKKTKKSYSQGHCFVCMKKLASCDMCIMKPETCHYDQGTCREPQWGEENCMVDHFVYLSNTSSLLVEDKIAQIRAQFGDDAIEVLNAETTSINYPVTQHPTKITSHNFDKNPEVTGVLQGIKGQYMIFDTGVINIRKFTSYEVEVSS
ncbi:DUF2797 domain-containing protein, partial [Vibrio sinaloensis]|uniref:DUF2797 domain-containing protein n=1 Tax=Photobacterium sp. (strain ATCC 43367) TaxID=379097 RepID=UPI002F408D60